EAKACAASRYARSGDFCVHGRKVGLSAASSSGFEAAGDCSRLGTLRRDIGSDSFVHARGTGRSRSGGVTGMMKAGQPGDKGSGMEVTLPLNGIIARVALADGRSARRLRIRGSSRPYWLG